jgi:hypothetical protein
MAMTVLLVGQATLQAQECRVIRIQGMTLHQSFRAEPETVQVSKGSCVIWFNRSEANIKVIFEEGKKCASMSEAPVGFSLDHNECFVTSGIPFGGTSSLRFKEEGTFDYVIEIGELGEKGKKVATGRIIVR